MAEPKTRPTTASVPAFLAKVKDPGVRADCEALVTMMSAVTKAPPVMWGTSIVGFGSYPYRYERGRALDWPLTGFAPRAKQIVLYVMPGCDGYDAMLEALGPVKCGVSCIYVKRLAELDQAALKKLLKASVAHLKKTHG
jgi:Domain of unknown function (DU1801)